MPQVKDQIDTNAATTFLRAITADWFYIQQDVRLELRCLFPGKTPQIAHFHPTEAGIAEAADFAANMNRYDYNIYPVINPVKAEKAVSGRAASDDDIAAAVFHWADSDDQASADALRNFAGPRPNMVVITGTTPLVRPHAYWHIADGPITDLAAWRAVQEGIAATFGSDPTVVNASRIMRLPGMVNWPTDKKAAAGRVAEIATVTVFEDRERVPFDRMQRTFGGATPARTVSGQALEIDTGGMAAPLDRERTRIQALSGQDWHNAVIKLVASYVSRGLSDDEIHGLTDPLTLPGYTVEQTRREVQTAINGARRKGWTPEPGPKTFDGGGAMPNQAPHIIADFKIKSSDEFLADLEPLEYLIDGILPSGVVYSLTGYPGHGKTTLAIQFGLSVALGKQFAERNVTPGDVLFLAGENPYNLKWQYAAALAAADVKTCDRMHFVEGHFSISAMIEILKQKMTDLPNLKLVIIDSLQAFFEGDDDNANIKMVEAARRFREVGDVESRPGILVIAHPAGKEPRKDNLVPRGGGAFLAEIDGNLTVWSPGDDMQSLHHSPKFRGAGFEPIEFVMVTHEFSHLTDANGTPLKLKVSRKAFQIEEATRADYHNKNLRSLLLELSSNPRMSQREMATRTGIPRSSVQRLLDEARDEKLIKRHAKGWQVTSGGEEYLDV
jgi:hypothetical protein